MALEVSGKLIQLLPPQQGNGGRGPWSKQEFVIETTDQYPKKICISAWNDRASQVGQIPIGSTVRVSINIESREYNGKWYTDIRMWNIAIGEATAIDPTYPGTQYVDAPIQPMNQGMQSAPISEVAQDSSDDLPF